MFLSQRDWMSLTCGVVITANSLFGADAFDQSRVPLEVTHEGAGLARVVLLAGSPSNKAGQHEYFAGCALFMNWLRQTPGVDPVMARDGWPKNEAIFVGCRTVVCFMDGGGKQPFIEPARLQRLQSLMDAGTGLVVLHQGVDCPKGLAEPMQAWLGAVWLPDIGCRGHWDMSFSQFPDHPILRGVQPFTARGDGWLYNLHVIPGMKGITPLLQGTVPPSSRTTRDAKLYPDRQEMIAWAYERPKGGRSFAFTGCDLHQNWEVESQRRFVINGILWTANVGVPNQGAPVELDPADLQRNLDDKRAATSTVPAAGAAGAK